MERGEGLDCGGAGLGDVVFCAIVQGGLGADDEPTVEEPSAYGEFDSLLEA